MNLKLSVYLLCLSLTIFVLPVASQEPIRLDQDEPNTLKDRIFYGGSLGLQFGNITLIDISPMLGYKLTPRIGVGINPTYKYYSYKNYYGQGDNLKTNVLGAGLFGRVLILDQLFAHAEYEYLAYKTKDPLTPGQNYTNEFQSVLVGAGYRERVGNNAFMYLLVLWNLNETIDSPYSNPIIRAGFSIGF